MYKKYLENKDSNELWPIHMYGRKVPYIMIEKLTNLKKVGRNFDFKVIAFPIHIKGGSAGWSRVVAIIDD